MSLRTPRLPCSRGLYLWAVPFGAAVMVVLTIGLSACSGSSASGGTPAPEDPSTTPAQPQDTATPTEPTATPSPQPTATPTPEPTPEPPPQAFLDLESQLQEQIAAHPYAAEIAVAVTDLQTGGTIHVNGDRPHFSACVINLFVILEATRMVQEGELVLSDIQWLVEATTWSSNATTANSLYGIVGEGSGVEGVRRVAAYLEELRLDDTIIDHPPSYGGISIGVDPNNWTTALDANRALEMLYHRELLDEEHTQFVLGAMGEVKVGLNYLTASAVPAGVEVSHKNGFFSSSEGFVDNDAGIVRFWRDGEEYAYAVSFFSQYNPYKLSQLPLAQAMMANIWAYFDEAYPGSE